MLDVPYYNNMLESEPLKQKQDTASETLEVEARTRQLATLSRGLFDVRMQYGAFYQAVDQALRKNPQLGIRSGDPRNYRQTTFLSGKTMFGVNPIVAEIQLGDDFHRGNGEPKLLSYTSYLYGIDGRKEIERFSPPDGYMGGPLHVSLAYQERVERDGSKTILESKGGKWIKTKYDPSGEEIKE